MGVHVYLSCCCFFCVPQRLIETAPFGEDEDAINQQIQNHNKFHSSIQRSQEVDRARDELVSALHGSNKYK